MLDPSTVTLLSSSKSGSTLFVLAIALRLLELRLPCLEDDRLEARLDDEYPASLLA
jgi:hypothetical protein